MWRTIRLHAVVVGAALALGCPQHAEESFLFPTEVVSTWSLGAVARPSTYVWTDPISLGIRASGDPRIQAYLIGAITTQARFLNVQMLARPEHNFWIYTDRQFAADFLKGEGPQFFEAYGLPPETAKFIFDRVVGMIAGASCAIYPIPRPTGQLKLLVAVNPYPFESAEFQDCAEIIMLEAFGANIRDQQFNRNAAYPFLIETYATADRNNPFASIPAVSKKTLEPQP